ncbi:unnamed protein product [Urochloa humidicola]
MEYMIWASINSLSGSVPKELGNLTNLVSLYIDSVDFVDQTAFMKHLSPFGFRSYKEITDPMDKKDREKNNHQAHHPCPCSPI